ASPWRNFRIAAAALIVFGVAGYMVGQLRERDAYRRRAEAAETAALAKDQQIAQLAQRVEQGDPQARAAFAAMFSPDARFGEMKSAAAGGAPDARFGRVVVDPAARQVQVFVYNLKPPVDGRDYQLWLIPEGGGAPMPAQVFKVDASGKGTATTAIPAGVTAVAAAAVSEEPAGGSKTGKPDVVKLVGKPG
ncbi:MAG TPA: anti-sigma factor, partial [Humisphaera sp.]